MGLRSGVGMVACYIGCAMRSGHLGRLFVRLRTAGLHIISTSCMNPLLDSKSLKL